MSRHARWLIALLMVFGSLAGCSADGEGCSVGSGDHLFIDAGQPRSFRMAVPPSGASRQTPMVVSMHGATGNREEQEKITGFSTIGAEQGFIAVYPEGLGNGTEKYWDAAPGSGDVRFVSGLIDWLHGQGCSAPDSTVVSGFSMGAMMTARLLCEAPGLMSGAAMVGGVLPPEPGCRVGDDVEVLVVHGRIDQTVPFDGSLADAIAVRAGGPANSSYPGVTREAMAAMWAAAKGCAKPVTETQSQPGQTIVTWTGCGDAPTILYIYEGTGHQWDPVTPGLAATSRLILLRLGISEEQQPAAA